MTDAVEAAWHDTWEDVQNKDGENVWHFELLVAPGKNPENPPHSFIATLTVREWTQKEGTTGNSHKDWEPANPRVVHRSEHTSVVAAAKTVKKAAKRAELLRRGPNHD